SDVDAGDDEVGPGDLEGVDAELHCIRRVAADRVHLDAFPPCPLDVHGVETGDRLPHPRPFPVRDDHRHVSQLLEAAGERDQPGGVDTVVVGEEDVHAATEDLPNSSTRLTKASTSSSMAMWPTSSRISTRQSGRSAPSRRAARAGTSRSFSPCTTRVGAVTAATSRS